MYENNNIVFPTSPITPGGTPWNSLIFTVCISANKRPLLIKPQLQQNLNKLPLFCPKWSLFGAKIQKISINYHQKPSNFYKSPAVYRRGYCSWLDPDPWIRWKLVPKFLHAFLNSNHYYMIVKAIRSKYYQYLTIIQTF